MTRRRNPRTTTMHRDLFGGETPIHRALAGRTARARSMTTSKTP